jgi:hypothetical protein
LQLFWRFGVLFFHALQRSGYAALRKGCIKGSLIVDLLPVGQVAAIFCSVVPDLWRGSLHPEFSDTKEIAMASHSLIIPPIEQAPLIEKPKVVLGPHEFLKSMDSSDIIKSYTLCRKIRKEVTLLQMLN